MVEQSEVCKHRWSIIKRIYVSSNHWIVIQHCRKGCQGDRQVEYETKSANGRAVTSAITSSIRQIYTSEIMNTHANGDNQ